MNISIFLRLHPVQPCRKQATFTAKCFITRETRATNFVLLPPHCLCSCWATLCLIKLKCQWLSYSGQWLYLHSSLDSWTVENVLLYGIVWMHKCSSLHNLLVYELSLLENILVCEICVSMNMFWFTKYPRFQIIVVYRLCWFTKML